ncbi:ROK family protein [Bacillus sp. RG28]|uniref:ROK family protein n=1 Tax=Gottfriedia endophytica TaxID=2820819 RepID=A0A940NK27_9BACI|nr:ROK family protein [Gottfriedia endophytica]MBP0723629.1 ROK family protein [Gottfriedia endophytica]
MDYIVCFDIGGTFIKFGLLDRNGKMIFKDKAMTPKSNLQKSLPEFLVKRVKLLQNDFQIVGIGISSCGLINHERGEVLFSNNLPGYSGMKLAEILFNQLQLPVSVENDVKSACLGEMWKGAIQGKRNVVFLTLGTGIGSTIVIDGKIVNGSHHLAGELGHTVIVSEGRPCGCGRKGCYERYAATSALVNDFIEEKKKHGEVVERISGEEIFKLVTEEDPIALSVYKKFIRFISIGLTNVVHLLNPEAIIIGGGITEHADQFIQDINIELKKEIMPIYNQGNIVYPSHLGNDAGLYGACYILLKKLNKLQV